jgi:uncharacterized protein YndB with AHSA1/START domain
MLSILLLQCYLSRCTLHIDGVTPAVTGMPHLSSQHNKNICMQTTAGPVVSASVEVNAPIEKVWQLWATPEDIMQWNNLSADWHTTHVENDLHAGGRYLLTMGLKDGSFGFNYAGTYTEVNTHALIAHTLDDGRKTTITFSGNNPVTITETFETTDTEPADIQRDFCQAVLVSFKNYVEDNLG